MSPASFQYPSILKLFCFTIILANIIAAPMPAPKNLYDVFIESLQAKKCQMPKEIDLPFNKSSLDPTTFDYLADPLKECAISEALKDDEEVAPMLCKEIFEVLHNITCSHFGASLSPINSTVLSGEVCEEFIGMKDILPTSEQDKYLSGKLVDSLFCKIFCEKKKFKSLCQTLLWSYDIQAQIENAVEKLKGAEDIKVSQNQDSALDEPTENKNTDVKDNVLNQDSAIPTEDKNKSDNENVANNEIDVNVNDALLEPVLGEENKDQNGEQPFGTDLNSKKVNLEENNNLDDVSPVSKSLVTSPTSKTDSLISNITQKHGKILKLTNPVKNGVLVMGTNTIDQQNSPHVQTGNGKQGVNLGDSGEVKEKTPKLDENKVTGNGKPRKNKTHDHPSKTIVNEKPTAVVAGSNTDITFGTTTDVRSNESSTAVISNEANVIPVNPIPANNPEENEVNNNLNEAVKETLPVPGTVLKKTEKPKETDSGVSNKVNDVTNLKLESTTIQSYPDDDDGEQYLNDTENEDYAMTAEFENDVNTKEKSIKSSAGGEEATLNKDVHSNFDLPQRNSILHGQEDTPMISPFPEQEDSHFFFYFLSMVLILMAGYLLFHNKQKIIALIVEGRHERRRRSHGAGYKKLDTK